MINNPPKTLCEFCGERKYNKGFKAHERACSRKHHGVTLRERAMTVTFEAPAPTPTIRPEPPQRGESLVHNVPDADMTLSEGVAFAYRLFPEDSASFMAVFHLVSMKSGEGDPYLHLRGARDMLDLKLQALETES